MSKERDGDGNVTFRELREIADRLVNEAEARAEKQHNALNSLIIENRDSVQRLSGAYENHLAERAAHDATIEAATTIYRLGLESRISKLEANQYIQVALLAVTLIAAVVGLFKLFVH